MAEPSLPNTARGVTAELMPEAKDVALTNQLMAEAASLDQPMPKAYGAVAPTK